MSSQHDLIVAFERRICSTLATTIVELPFGAAVVTADLPDVFDSNVVWIDVPTSPAEVLCVIEGVATDAGWRHRQIEIADPAIADQLRETFGAAGYTEERYVTMALVAPPPPPAAEMRRSTAVVSVAEQLDLAHALLVEEPWDASEVVLDQFDRRERRMAQVVHARSVIAPPEAPVSRALLLTDGVIADLDAVSTLQAHRGRGWSGAVVRRAIDLALREGVDHVVLVADDQDWPRDWYGRLGFRQVGNLSLFRSRPQRR